MRETHLCTALRREILFIAACAAAAVLCVGLAFWFAVPQQPSQKQLPPDSTSLSEYWYVDLNTADSLSKYFRDEVLAEAETLYVGERRERNADQFGAITTPLC